MTLKVVDIKNPLLVITNDVNRFKVHDYKLKISVNTGFTIRNDLEKDSALIWSYLKRTYP